MNGIISGKSAELAKLKTDFADVVHDNDELTQQNKELDRLIVRLQSENKQNETENHGIAEKIEEATEKKVKNEKIVQQLEDEVERLLKANDDLKGQQEKVKAQVREKGALTKEVEHQLSENKKKIITLESRINDRKRVNEKLNSDIKNFQKEQENEGVKIEKASEKLDTLQGAIQ